MAKNRFFMYNEFWEQLELLSMEERGELITAVYAAVLGLEAPTVSLHVKMALSVILGRMKRDAAEYDKVCEQNRRKAEQRWAKSSSQSDAAACNSMQQHAMVCNGMQRHATAYDKNLSDPNRVDQSRVGYKDSGSYARARARKNKALDYPQREYSQEQWDKLYVNLDAGSEAGQ